MASTTKPFPIPAYRCRIPFYTTYLCLITQILSMKSKESVLRVTLPVDIYGDFLFNTTIILYLPALHKCLSWKPTT